MHRIYPLFIKPVLLIIEGAQNFGLNSHACLISDASIRSWTIFGISRVS